jgi:adenine-specific DNA-methyltransferase
MVMSTRGGRPKFAADKVGQPGVVGHRQLSLRLSDSPSRFGPVTDLAIAPAQKDQKELGAFYTPPEMARRLVDWAIRDANDRVLDPSFGGLVFLSAAKERLRGLGAPEERIAEQLFGVDLDPEACARAQEHDWGDLRSPHLQEGDFFDVDPGELPSFEAVVGNPPYVRYQSFNGRALGARKLALAAGVKLSRMASSWAPFVIHATSFVRPGGRLAQVLPAELLHAQYARPVIEFLRREFAEIEIVVFDGRVFPGALEEVVLLLASGRGAPGIAELRLLPYETSVAVGGAPQNTMREIDDTAGDRPLLEQLLPDDVRSLYRLLADHKDVATLGELASVDIGIVTGANEFFLLDRETARQIDGRLLVPAIGKAQQLPGAQLSREDHQDLLEAGSPALMFKASASSPKQALISAADHIAAGESEGFHERYKCRIREPWWGLPIPGDGPAGLLLTYFANDHPRIALNEARVFSTNTVHGVRPADPRLAAALAVGFYNSLTLLSAEIIGRSYGGGVMKLEPSEAEALLFPPVDESLAELLGAVDDAVRARDLEAALNLVDARMLAPLGLDAEKISRLRTAREFLRERRRRRGRRPISA